MKFKGKKTLKTTVFGKEKKIDSFFTDQALLSAKLTDHWVNLTGRLGLITLWIKNSFLLPD